jgi:hypothetical protein
VCEVTAVGYSGTPLAAKLGVRSGTRTLLVSAPDLPAFEPPADAVVQRRRGRGQYDVVVLFVMDAAALHARFASLVPSVATAGALWVCWPKKASGVATDLTEAVVRAHGLSCGLVDVKIAAIDATWSGLKFVRRLVDR